MVNTGIDRIFMSVSDMNKSLAYYRDFVGMKVIAEQNLEPDRIQQLWNLPKGTKGRAVYLNKDGKPTLLTLIEFQPHSGKTIRGGAKQWDYGIYEGNSNRGTINIKISDL